MIKKIREVIAKVYHYTVYKEQMFFYDQLVLRHSATIEECREYQLLKLQKLLKEAKQSVPYYSNLLPDLNEFDYESFQKIPFLTKSIIRQNIDELQNIHKEHFKNVYKNSSGGSTGEPVTFYQTKEYRDKAIANTNYANYLNKIRPYDRKLVLWGAVRDMHNSKKRSFFRKIKDFLGNKRMLNTFVMDEKIIQDYIDFLNEYKPSFIKAYVHSIYEISKYINRNNIRILFSPIIQTTTGPLYPQMREEIKKAFNDCHIFNYYGSREVSSIASEIYGRDGLQVMYDNIFVEIVDEMGNPVKKGEEGEIVVTSLNNYYMPLIRFKIGDRGVKGDEERIGTLVLEEVLGRTLGVIYREDGSYIDGQYFVILFFNNMGVEKFQLVQKDLKTLELKLIKAPGFNEEQIKDILIKINSELPGVDIHVKYVESIDTSSTGKVMYVYSELSNNV